MKVNVCRWCDSLEIGGDCTNLHCSQAKVKRSNAKKNNQKTKTIISRKRNAKAGFRKHIQSNGAVLIPSNIHLQREDSLPKFFGYKTDKKSTQENRRAALRELYNANLETTPSALNTSSIKEFGTAGSQKRKNKILSWFEGRIDRSDSPRLASSREKLVLDREYVNENF